MGEKASSNTVSFSFFSNVPQSQGGERPGLHMPFTYFFVHLLSGRLLTLELSVEPLAPMVAVRCEVEPEPVLAADHG